MLKAIRNAGQSVTSYITDQDGVVSPPHQKLHFQHDARQKTLIGGLISLGISIYVLNVAYERGKQMLQYGDPSMTSIEQGMDQDEVGKLKLNELSKPLLEFFDSGFNSVDLEAENYK